MHRLKNGQGAITCYSLKEPEGYRRTCVTRKAKLAGETTKMRDRLGRYVIEINDVTNGM